VLTRLLATFGRGGIHPDPHKEATAHMPVENLPAPSQVILPLSQNLGEPATPIVKKGEAVRRGQKIAEGGETGVPLHASISGKVKLIDKQPHPTLLLAPAIVIAREPGAPMDEMEFPENPEWQRCAPEEALRRVREAGIVGLGGAAFPTWRKLSLPPGVSVDMLILNGAECEPYLTSDFRLMVENPAAILEGGRLMARILGVREVVLGVEADKMEAQASLERALASLPASDVEIRFVPCQTRYPQGAEKQLVYALSGRVVPPRALPSAVGVMVQNVATAASVYEAVRFGRPLLDRVVTVTGPGVQQPRNVRAPLGTQLSELTEFCGGTLEEASRIVAGGPMMGRTIPRLDVPLTKGINGLVLLTGRSPFSAGYGPCISCSRCIDVCPLGLEPDRVSVHVEAGRQLDTEPFGALDCYECGCCTYVCPAHRPLVQFMQVAKASLRRSQGARLLRD
jgi:Na+-translocating ferredoxin:NAD+ oxidoreductase subunit C